MRPNAIRAALLRAALALSIVLLLCGCTGERGGEASVPVPAASSAIETAAPAQDTPVPTEQPTPTPTAEPTPAPTEEPADVRAIRDKLASMTTEEKLCQLLMFGFPTGENGLPGEGFISLLDNYPIGNIVFVGSNIDKADGAGGFASVKRVTELIENEYPAPVPRLFAADVEGGSVVRFDWEPKIPSARSLGGMEPDEVRAVFRNAAEKLRENGVNTDLAPVFDISSDPLSTAMGSRIISSELETVISIGGAVTEGLHEGGCISCAKHFPGHGGTEADSHGETPTVSKTLDELMEYDVAAFAGAIDAGVDCVMAAHILYPALDPENIATLSPAILTGLLREQLGFTGVVISDDMLMDGLRDTCSCGEAAVRFLLAGGDMILVGGSIEEQKNVIRSLLAAAEDGTLSPERIDESVSRILALKLEYGVWDGR